MSNRIIDEALEWHILLSGEGEGASASDINDNWSGFVEWLERDPRHAQAYDEVSQLDHGLTASAPAIATLLPANDIEIADEAVLPHESWFTRRKFGLGLSTAVAAMAAILFVPTLSKPEHVVHKTGHGEYLQVVLDDGSRVQLAPDSRLTVNVDGQDELALSGVAFFDVPHRPDRVMNIQVGGLQVRDIGTRFELSTAQGFTRVAVSEGQVTVSSSRLVAPISIQAGRSLVSDPRAGKVELSDVHSGEVASWREGRLVYRNSPIYLVAADISRYSGQSVDVDKSLEGKRFSGVLVIGDGTRLARNVQQIMGIQVRESGNRIRFVDGGMR